MSKSRIFFYCVIAFLAGVTTRSFLISDLMLAHILFLAALIIFAINYDNKKVWIFSAIIIFFALGIWRTDSQIIFRTATSQNEKNIQLLALVISSPVNKEFFDQIMLYFNDLNIHAIANIPRYSDISYGDKVDAKCQLAIPENFSTGQAGKENDFDYHMYLAKEHVEYICNKASIKKISEQQRGDIFAKLIKIKKYFENKLYSQIPQPEGALAAGLLFGGGSGLSKEMQDSFSKTGTTHIIAVSGYNVTIVAEYFLMLGILLGFWRKQAIWFAIAGLVFFVIMVGMPASAVRAGVMSGILLWALRNGRISGSTNAILLAASIMLWINPLLLRWDIGFQLSFLATIGVIICSDIWQRSRFSKIAIAGFMEIIVLTLGAQIFVWPIIAYNFQTFSVISLIANIFILPTIPFSMMMVFLVAASGFFLPYASFLFAWLAYIPLHYEVVIVRFLGNISWASIAVENMPAYFLVIYYIMLTGAIFVIKKYQFQKIPTSK